MKSLLAQFGTKAKVADDIESDAKRLRSNIEALMAKAQAKVNKVCHLYLIYLIITILSFMKILNDLTNIKFITII